jgi:hypothetical protein
MQDPFCLLLVMTPVEFPSLPRRPPFSSLNFYGSLLDWGNIHHRNESLTSLWPPSHLASSFFFLRARNNSDRFFLFPIPCNINCSFFIGLACWPIMAGRRIQTRVYRTNSTLPAPMRVSLSPFSRMNMTSVLNKESSTKSGDEGYDETGGG